MTLTVSPVYAGLLIGLLLWLSAQVILYRRSNRLSVGDEGDRVLLKKMRVQANCAEYAPIGIVALVMIDLLGAPVWVVHILGIMLLMGRIAHAYGMSKHPQDYRFRSAGMVLTLMMLGISALGLIAHSIL